MDIAELKDTKADLLNRAEQLKAQRQTFSDVFNGGNPLTVGEFNILSGILERSTDKEADTNRFTQALIYNRQQGIDLADAYANIEALNEAQMGKKGEYTKAWTQAVSDSFRVGELNKQRSELGMKFHDLEAAGKDTAEIMAEIDAIDAQIEQLQDNTPRGLGVTLMKWAAGTIPYTGDVLLKGATAGMAAALVATGVGAIAGVPMLAAATLGTSYTLASLAYGGAAVAFGWKRTADLSRGAMYYDLRKQGVEKNIAEWASSADGWVQGAIENFLGLTPMAAKAVGNALGREAATGITTRVLSKMYANGIIGGIAAGATKWAQGAAGEGAEEFFQSIADSVTEYAVAEISDSGYTFDKTAKEVLKQALYEGVAGFGSALVLGGLPAAINTRADMGYSRNLKNEAELIPSKEMFIRRHQNDEQFSELTAAQRKDTLGEIYDRNHTIEGVSNAEAANLDTDYLAINESADEEESEAQATDTPQEPIKRRKDHRLHTQESITVTENADGSESHTLKLGSADSRRRYGRIEFTVNGDTVTIDNVYLKAGQEALTGEFVTELMRRYEGYNIEWQPTTESQIKVRDQLIKDNKENPGQLQMFKGKNMDEVLEAAGYIKEKLPNLNRHEATVAAGLMRVIAEGRGRTLQQFIHDDIQFKTFAEAVANDVMSEQEAALNKGAYQLIENGTKAIIYVGKEGDFSTLFHEVVHFISQTSPQSKDLATALKGAADTDQFRQYLEQHKRIMDSTGLKTADDIINAIKDMSDNPMEWNRAQNEIVAVLGETYAQEGRTFNSELKGLFDKIIDFFMKIYRMMKQNALLNDDIVKAYDALLAGNPELKAQMERSEQAETTQNEGQVLHQIIGERGAKALDMADEGAERFNNLNVAREMEEAKKDASTIKQATGWERGKDGLWRYEIPDGKFKKDGFYTDPNTIEYRELEKKFLVGSLTKEERDRLRELNANLKGKKQELRFLSDYYDAPGLYAAYPKLKGVFVRFETMDRHTHGSYDPESDTITLNNSLDEKQMESTLIHEIQHAIQHIEGFARGGSIEEFAAKRNWANKEIDRINEKINEVYSKMKTISEYDMDADKQAERRKLKEQYNSLLDERSKYVADIVNLPFETYSRLAGEVESRNVQQRIGLSRAERMNKLLAETEDVAREDQIVLMNGATDAHSNLMFQPAFHGSGASFDKFDTAFMGTGEGAQAFGWGLYLSQSEGIARDYARRMAKGTRYELISNNKPIQGKDGYEISIEGFSDELIEASSKGNHEPLRKELIEKIKYDKELISRYEKIIKDFDEAIEKTKENGITVDKLIEIYGKQKNRISHAVTGYKYYKERDSRRTDIEYIRSVLESYRTEEILFVNDIKAELETLEAIDINSFEARHRPNRNLYTVTIPDDNGSNYLYWDKNYKGKEKETIRERIEAQFDKEGLSWQPKYKAVRWNSEMNYKRGTDGRDIYELIKDVFKHEESLKGKFGWSMRDYAQQASEFLNRAGFVGIDYPANSMSGGNKYGKRNFVIFNADDITIDNHLFWQGKTQQELEDSLMADAKGQTLDEWLDFNRFLGDSNLDEAALTAIWEKANHVTEVEGEKVVEAAPLSEEEKDTAFRAMIDTDDGVRKFIQDLRSVDAYIRDIEREGMSDEEDMDFLNRLADASKRIETEAAPFIKNLLKNNNELSEESIKKVRGMVERNLAAYRDLYAAASGNENLTSNIEALPFIDEPTRERMQTMSIAEKRRLVDNLEAQELKKKILKGEELYEGEAEKVVKMLDAEIQKLEGEKEALKASLDNKQDWLDIKEKKLLNAAEEAKATEKAINKLERNIRSRLDKGMRISKEDYQKLAGWKDKLELLQDDVNALNKQTKLKAILQEREKYRQKQAELKQKQKERQFAKKVHDYKVKLASYIMKKPSKTVNWEQAEQILALQAVFGRTSGYDNFFINMNGKRLNLTAFRGMIDRGEINIAGLTDYQLKRYFNKSLAEYTVQDLETLADTVRYLTEQGRHEWQAKVDQRAFEAMQWQNLLINEIAGNPRYTDAGDEPLPETGESEKKKRTFAQLVRTGWYKTLNMARKAQILDGNRKATAYRLLVEEKRAVQEREYEAIRNRMRPVTELMEKLGVKAEDFYEMHTLKIGKNEQHYTTSQLIYGLKAQLEQRNMEAFVYGNLISQREKEFYGHNDNSLRLIGEARLDDFIKQAQAILAGKENIMKVAEAIWNDWQDKDNFARLNRAAIDEYNMPVDPVAFYMPISRKDFNGTELAAKIADDLYNTNAGKGMTAVEKGMINARLTISPDHQMPVDMDYFKLWTDSVADQEHFIASNAYVRKLNRVFKALGSKDLRANIEAVYGQGMMNDIDNYINEVANPNINTDTQGVNKFLSFLRGALYPAYLAFKSSSVILQMITSPAPFLREVGPVELANGLIQMSLHPVETWKYVTERSAMMENRSMNPLIDEVKKAAEKYTDPKYKQLWHKIQETGTMGLEMADRWAVTAGWLAVFDKKKAEYEAQGMEAKQAEREAVKYADAVVLETQPTGDKTELAPLFKAGGPAWQAFTQFQVSLNVIWNNLTYDVANSDFRNHEVRKAMGTLIGYALAGVILYSVQEGFDDDDDAEDIILKLLYGATTQYTSSIPLVSSNIDNIIKSKMTGEAWYSRGSQLYPGLDALAQGVATGNVDKLARAVGIFSGAPVSGWKEFEHSFYNRKKGEWRFYPKAFLGRREK